MVTVSVVLAGLLVSVGVWEAVSSPGRSVLSGPSGAPAAPFSIAGVQPPGATVTLRSFRGRPLVINFWASWCVPCRTEMPLLEAAYRQHHRDVAFVGIDVNDTTQAARAFLAQVGVTYPVGADPDNRVTARYGTYGLPTTVFVSSAGVVVGRSIGQLHATTLRRDLQQAFRV